MSSDRNSTILWDGLLGGWVAGCCVLAVFTVYDLLTTELLRTPSVLYAHFFHGLDAARSAETDATGAVVYTVLHFAVWIGAGMCAAYIAALRPIYPALWYAVVIGPFVIFCVFLWAAGVWGVPGLGVHHFWIGGLLGGAAMAATLLWRNPRPVEAFDD